MRSCTATTSSCSRSRGRSPHSCVNRRQRRCHAQVPWTALRLSHPAAQAGGMTPPTTPDERAGRIAARHHGLITVTQALTCGLSSDRIAHRARSGRWERLARGVFRVAGAPVSPTQTLYPAVLAAGRGAAACGLSALSLYGAGSGGPARPQITVRPSSDKRSTRGWRASGQTVPPRSGCSDASRTGASPLQSASIGLISVGGGEPSSTWPGHGSSSGWSTTACRRTRPAALPMTWPVKRACANAAGGSAGPTRRLSHWLGVLVAFVRESASDTSSRTSAAVSRQRCGPSVDAARCAWRCQTPHQR